MTALLRRRRARRLPGLYRALVVDVVDPQALGRVQVSVPLVSGAAASWAPVLRDLGPRPRIGDEVLVGFEAGLVDHPIVVGVLAAAASTSVEIADENGNSIRLSPSGIEVNAASRVRMTSSEIDVTASMVRVDAAMSEFAGVVQCSTLIADSVVAASYTPGAGNVW